MAPRAIESRDQVVARLRGAAERGGEVMRFGGHHFTHVVVVRGGAWQVRRLVLDPAKGAAYLREHGMFMPEHAEMLSEPGDEVLVAAGSREGLIAAVLAGEWPIR
jgi:hypothetical protein